MERLLYPGVPHSRARFPFGSLNPVQLLISWVSFFPFSFLTALAPRCRRAFSSCQRIRDYSLVVCAGFSSRWLLLWQSTGAWLSVVSALWLSCSEACGVFLAQG